MEIVLDAGPLIYLAKLDALDAIAIAGHAAVVPPSVFAEAARPGLAFRHPEIATIMRMSEEGGLHVVEPDRREAELATKLGSSHGGLHAGELDVLAIGSVRGWPVCFHERQAARLALALGVATVHVVEILFGGTPANDLLARRIREFARLTNMKMNDADLLLSLVVERR